MEMQNEYSQPKKKLHIAARIICLLLAFLIWFVVAGLQGDNFKRTICHVSVRLVGTDSLTAYTVTDFPEDITVTVKGDHSKVNRVTADDITVEVDVSAIKEAGKLKVPATIVISPKLDGIVAYGDYTVEVTVQAVKEPDAEAETK